MDRKISKEKIQKRNRNRYIWVAIFSFFLITGLWGVSYLLKPRVSLSNVTISEVDCGSVDISVSCFGKVVPLYEEIITSPVSSKILNVFKKTGDSLSLNEPIIELDLLAFHTDIEKQKDDVEIKKSWLENERISANSVLSDIKIQIEIEEKRLERLKVLLKNEIHLDSIGSSTKDRINQVKLELEVQTLQLEQLILKYENQQRKSEADIRKLELDYKMALKNMMLLEKTLAEAQVRAPQKAILTWINDNIGATVSPGAQLAIISDLSNFKIVAEISDSYTHHITSGSGVEIKIGNQTLTGIVGNIVPSVSNGMIVFTVMLDKSDNPNLRSGLRVDLYVINSVRENILRIDNRSFYAGPGYYNLWVLQDNLLVKREVELGEASYEKIEILSGLEAGEKVVVSDMTNYQNEKKIYVKGKKNM